VTLGGRSLIGGVVGALMVGVVAGGVVAGLALPGGPFRAASYGWPIKPFDQQHPIRGVFGDPRTLFHGPPVPSTLLTGGCACSFHYGIDLPTRPHQAVYAVTSGTVVDETPSFITVDSGHGRLFSYWHLDFLVKRGDHVEAGTTILGRSRTSNSHVHFSESDNGRLVNPLQPGHLTPYVDTVPPRVSSISFRAADGVTPELANFVRGPLVIVAEASDASSFDAVGDAWCRLPVTPALLTWRIEQWNGKVVLHERTAVDFRRTAPPNSRFWATYARGSFQNVAGFGNHYSWAQPGVYLFKLTARPFDTRRLRDGSYDVIVTAADIRGNSSSLSQRFSVHNKPGWR
jgi:hypothetical protein